MRSKTKFNICRKGHAISGGAETLLRVPKLEMTDGKLFNSDSDRIFVLGLLLESVGIDAAVKLGALQLWREALNELDESKTSSS